MINDQPKCDGKCFCDCSSRFRKMASDLHERVEKEALNKIEQDTTYLDPVFIPKDFLDPDRK